MVMLIAAVAVFIVILFLIWQIIRWWNLPEVTKARAERAETWQKNRTERLRIRRESWGRWRKKSPPPKDPKDPTKPVETKKPNRRREWFFRRKRNEQLKGK